ncbi:MAG: ATP-binding protein [Myxococcota bacterium]
MAIAGSRPSLASRRLQRTFLALRLLVGLVTLTLLASGLLFAREARRKYALRLQALSAVEHATELAALQARERGWTAVLLSEGGRSPERRAQVAQRRAEADSRAAALWESLAQLRREVPGTDFQRALARLEETSAAVRRARQSIDEGSPPDVAGWLSTISEAQEALHAVRDVASRTAETDPGLQLLRELALDAAEHAGWERAHLAAAIVSGASLSRTDLDAHSARFLMARQALARLEVAAAPELADAVRRVSGAMADEMAPMREAVLKAGRDGSSYPVDVDTWLATATATIDSVLGLARRTLHAEQDSISTFRARARLATIAPTLIAVLLFLGSTAGGQFIRRRVMAPLARLQQSAHRIASGDLSTPLLPEYEDELGEVARSFEMMRQRLAEQHAAREQLIAQLSTAQHELARSARLSAVAHLAAGVAHEINTPLQVVHDSLSFVRDASAALPSLVAGYRSLATRARDAGAGWPELLALPALEEAGDTDYVLEELPRATERATASMQRIAEVTRMLRNLSPLDGRGEQGEVDVNRLVRSVTELLAAGQNAQIDLELSSDLPPVRANASELSQCLGHLVSNALDAMESVGGPRRLVVRSRTAGSQVEVDVADTGPGIPADIQDRVFEPFFTTRVGRRAGNGLAFARAIAERCGGDLRFHTGPSGTTFTLRLPREPGAGPSNA